MKVLYDVQAFMWDRYSGIPRYYSELIRQLMLMEDIAVNIPKTYCLNEYYKEFFPAERLSPSWRFRDSLINMFIGFSKKNPARYLTSAFHDSANLIETGDFDVFHPTFFDPYFLKYIGKKPYVLTIHDLSIEIFPEYVSLSLPTLKNTKEVIRDATHFISVSECTKKLFTEYHDIDSDMVTVAHLGPSFTKDDADATPNLSIHTTSRSYLLFVNVRGGRKNTYSCLSIISNIVTSYDIDIVCAGGGPFSSDELSFFSAIGIRERIYQYSVTDNQLINLYKGALAFIFPSLDEGFGIPILEAFACGCPLILSDVSCLPEIAGDAAVYFSPKSISSVREAVCRVLDDEKLREELRRKGYQQISKYSWEKCAKQTKAVYARACE